MTATGTTKLKLWLGIFLIALAVPSGVLIQQAYSQLKWQSFHHYRLVAKELARRMDQQFRSKFDNEAARQIADYQFRSSGSRRTPAAPSPLSHFPSPVYLPGTIGYFQVDSQGIFSSPLLPRGSTAQAPPGIAEAEFRQRLALQNRIRDILSQNRLVGNGGGQSLAEEGLELQRDLAEESSESKKPNRKAAAERSDSAVNAPELQSGERPIPKQAAFDQLNNKLRRDSLAKKRKQPANLGRISDFNLDYSYQSGLAQQSLSEKAETKRSPVPRSRAPTKPGKARESSSLHPAETVAVEAQFDDEVRIRTFESTVDPFEFSLLDSGHFVVFRKVWRNRERLIQGLLIEQQPFLKDMTENAFADSALPGMSSLMVAYQGDVFSAVRGQNPAQLFSRTEDMAGALLYQMNLSPPLNDIELLFSVTQLPLGPGGTLITWLAIVLAAVLLGGFYLMYRTISTQMHTVQQQQNFVSAISHELKTPLTSIRMYSEILREGWASEDKKKSYYDYILSESERLTRLINNVLQLARLGRRELNIEIKTIPVASLISQSKEKIELQTERAGFTLELLIDPKAQSLKLCADPDAFTQIVINLVDNAIKFSRKSERKSLEFGCEQQSDGSVRFRIRDFGPGIAPDQMKKIFRLFYRPENEMTRETVGTGIGLALVKQLAERMQARVNAVNRSPGAEFSLTFPVDSR